MKEISSYKELQINHVDLVVIQLILQEYNKYVSPSYINSKSYHKFKLIELIIM